MRAALSNAEHPFILAAIAENLSRLGDKEKALTILKKAHTNHPHSAAPILGVIKTLAQTGRRKEAMRFMKRCRRTLKTARCAKTNRTGRR